MEEAQKDPKPQGARPRMTMIIQDSVDGEIMSTIGPFDAAIVSVLDGEGGKITSFCNISSAFDPPQRIKLVVELGRSCVKVAANVAQDIAVKSGMAREIVEQPALEGVDLKGAPGRGHSLEN